MTGWLTRLSAAGSAKGDSGVRRGSQLSRQRWKAETSPSGSGTCGLMRPGATRRSRPLTMPNCSMRMRRVMPSMSMRSVRKMMPETARKATKAHAPTLVMVVCSRVANAVPTRPPALPAAVTCSRTLLGSSRLVPIIKAMKSTKTPTGRRQAGVGICSIAAKTSHRPMMPSATGASQTPMPNHPRSVSTHAPVSVPRLPERRLSSVKTATSTSTEPTNPGRVKTSTMVSPRLGCVFFLRVGLRLAMAGCCAPNRCSDKCEYSIIAKWPQRLHGQHFAKRLM